MISPSAICGSWRYARGEAAQCTRSPLHVGQCKGMATTGRIWRWERPATTAEEI